MSSSSEFLVNAHRLHFNGVWFSLNSRERGPISYNPLQIKPCRTTYMLIFQVIVNDAAKCLHGAQAYLQWRRVWFACGWKHKSPISKYQFEYPAAFTVHSLIRLYSEGKYITIAKKLSQAQDCFICPSQLPWQRVFFSGWSSKTEELPALRWRIHILELKTSSEWLHFTFCMGKYSHFGVYFQLWCAVWNRGCMCLCRAGFCMHVHARVCRRVNEACREAGAVI